MYEARYYEIKDGAVFCTLCPRSCRIAPGRYGACRVRTFPPDAHGLITENYGVISSRAVDPVEKKPLYHFHPGEDVFSIGTFGCNLCCPWCQNWQISQQKVSGEKMTSPEEIITLCGRSGCDLIAYTYSEPVVWFEYVVECSLLAHDKKIKNILVTNANCASAPWRDLMDLTDACNIDLKSFNPSTLSKLTGASLRHVCDAIAVAAEKTHVEITTLIVPGVNDSESELAEIASFIASINPEIPWHITRYYPNFRYTEPPTDISLIERVRQSAVKILSYVYCGNFATGSGGSDTRCPSCGATVISRRGYSIDIKGLEGQSCKKCGRIMPVLR